MISWIVGMVLNIAKAYIAEFIKPVIIEVSKTIVYNCVTRVGLI